MNNAAEEVRELLNASGDVIETIRLFESTGRSVNFFLLLVLFLVFHQ